MPDYDRAPSDVLDFVRNVASEWRTDLTQAGVTFACFIASPTEKEQDEEAPHLRFEKRRLPAYAKLAKGEAQLHRVPDVTIFLCDETWRASDEHERTAIVACALQRVAIDREKDGQPKTTKYNRPKLVEVQPDIVIVGHRANVSRFGERAPEAMAMKGLFAEYTQRLMDWASDVAPIEDDAPPSSDEVLGVAG